jgi:hypothetical protein
MVGNRLGSDGQFDLLKLGRPLTVNFTLLGSYVRYSRSSSYG